MKRFIMILAVLILAGSGLASFQFDSLRSAAATGAGDWFTVSEETASGFSWRVVVTGSPSASTVNLEGCIENDLADCTSTKIFTIDTSATTSSEMRHVVNKDTKHMRCNLATLTGGTNPTVSCRVYKGRKSQ